MRSFSKIQSILCTTTTIDTQNFCPLLTCGHCSEVGSCYTDINWYSKMVVDVDRWSLFGCVRWLRFDYTFNTETQKDFIQHREFFNVFLVFLSRILSFLIFMITLDLFYRLFCRFRSR
jgi:hypothetical protein